VNRLSIAAKLNMNHANRWTDNMFTVKEYLTSGKGVSPYIYLMSICIYTYRYEYRYAYMFICTNM
jgi:hypothetical protein